MGGHGGLNILPQKRWHLYRDDNRAKVARDEAEDRLRQYEEEKRKRILTLDKKIGQLRAKAVEAGLDTPVSHQQKSDVIEDKIDEARETKRRRKNEDTKNVKKMNSGDTEHSTHINFFIEEENEMKKKEKAHAKYLNEVGHDATSKSDFDKIIDQTSTPWYMQTKKDLCEAKSNTIIEKRHSSSCLHAVRVINPSKTSSSASMEFDRPRHKHGEKSKAEISNRQIHKKDSSNKKINQRGPVMSQYRIGQRLVDAAAEESNNSSPFLGTVRYIGALSGCQHDKVWVGIEWDCPNRGKNDGALQGHRYFNCQRSIVVCPKSQNDTKDDKVAIEELLTSGSFVSANYKLYTGLTLDKALESRYCTPSSKKELLLIGGETSASQKIVDIVGAQKAEQHFRNLNNLEVIDLSGQFVRFDNAAHQSSDGTSTDPLYDTSTKSQQVSAADIIMKVPEVISSIKFFCLNNHLLSNFTEACLIISRFPNLETLQLENSVFSRDHRHCRYHINEQKYSEWHHSFLDHCQFYPIVRWEESGMPTFESVKKMNLKSSHIEWIDLCELTKIFPKLIALDLSHSSHLFDLLSDHWLSKNQKNDDSMQLDDAIKDIDLKLFPSLTSLFLYHSTLRSWRQFVGLMKMFPNLVNLGLSSPYLTDYQVEDLHLSPNLNNSSLKELGIERCNIRCWSTISVLSSVFPQLISLRWQGNPLQITGNSSEDLTPSMSTDTNLKLNEVQSSTKGQELSRQITIAIFPALEFLNGCEVSEFERKNAERYFLSLCSKKHAICSQVDPKEIHQQRLELIHTTKLFDLNLSSTSQTISKTGSSLVEIKIQPNSESLFSKNTITRKVPLFLKISDIKTMCQKMFQLPSSRQRLSMRIPLSPLPIQLSENDLSLLFYGVENDSTIFVQDINDI